MFLIEDINQFFHIISISKTDAKVNEKIVNGKSLYFTDPVVIIRISEVCRGVNGKKKSCYIVGAGAFDGFRERPLAEDVVIAADGGYTYLESEQIRPDLLIGDFDSLGSLLLASEDSLRPEAGGRMEIRRLPPVKDNTDMYEAVQAGLERGCEVFHIYGGLGGRLSHSLANIQIVAELSQSGIEGYLYQDKTVVTALTNGSMKLPGSFTGYVSVFCHSDRAEGVFERNLRYALSDAVLTNHFPLGISNEGTGREGEISVREGTLIILLEEKVM